MADSMTQKPTFLTAPDPKETGWPKGVKYIIGNEGCERFSFYGMRAILYIYLAHLLKQKGMATDAAESGAIHLTHVFNAGVYALPIVGAVIADRLLGKYRTILYLSMVYCLGHAFLAFFENNLSGFMAGLCLIAIGSGGIKPCVSAHVGDQFGAGNWNKIEKVYQAFYFIVNFGSFFSTLLVPWLQVKYGASVAFAVPGILMAIATVFFWMGRNVFVHVPAKPGGYLGLLDTIASIFLFLSIGTFMFGGSISETYAAFGAPVRIVISLVCLAVGFAVFSARQAKSPDDGFLAVLFYSAKVKLGGKEEAPLPAASEVHTAMNATVAADRAALAKSPFYGPAVRRFGVVAAEGPPAVLRILSVFLLVSVFWSLFDQHGSSWIRQAQDMDKNINLFGLKFEILGSQIQAANPILVMMLVPFFSIWGYPLLEKISGHKMTPLRRMTIGMSIASFSFVAVAIIQIWIGQAKAAGGPAVPVIWQMIPFILLTAAEVMVSITGLEFAYTQAPKRMKSTVMSFWLFTVSLGNELVAFLAGFEKLPLTQFFWIFAGLMAVAAVIFGVIAYFYKYKDYSQSTANDGAVAAH